MAERLRGLTGVSIPTPVLGVIVAVLTLPVAFGSPAGGLDGSWVSGLYMATDEGMNFGTDIVYTFGPLGFLFYPVLWVEDLAAISFVFATVLWIAYGCALLWAIKRNVGAIAAVVVAYLVLALLPSAEQALVLTSVVSFAVLWPERPRWALPTLIVGGGIFAAIEILVKLSVGPVILALILAALIGARARPWQIGAFVGIFAGTTAVLWLVTGNELGDLIDYVINGRQIISGYSEALGVPLGPGLLKVAAAGSLLLLIAAAAIGRYPDRVARWAGIAIAGIAGFAIYKEGIVRSDEGHMTIAMATMVALFLVIPWREGTRLLHATVAAGIAVIALVVPASISTFRLNPIDSVRASQAQFELLFSPDRRQATADFSRALMVSVYALDPETLAQLRGRTVSIDPWEISVAWAYDLDWSPVPIFQNYQAYTEELDELNAERIAAADGPERILRENPAAIQGNDASRGVDNHYAAWDPPAQALATLCNFEPLHTTNRWQVLGRVPDRCGEPRRIASVDAAYGEAVEIPQAGPDEVVFVRIEGAGVEGLEKLRSLLYRSNFRYAVLDGDESYRFVPGTAEDGLLLDGNPRLTGVGPWEQAPRAETIELEGVDGDLRYDFYAMSVDAGEAETNPERGG